MVICTRRRWLIGLSVVGLGWWLGGVGGLAAVAQEPAAIDFSKDIQPLLSRHCFTCHGPDEGSREAGLRLDRADAALAELDSGVFAIVPGDPARSELLARITSDDPDLRMPPASSGTTLSDAEIARLKRWIAEGATFADHWSFRPLSDPEPPAVQHVEWVRNPIDRFVLAKLEQEGLTPSPEADRATLLRRLSLDLLGLPPTPEQVAEFLNDSSPTAYADLVERLLASPHFGERWGRHWLDLAHFADSDGYLGDALRPNAWLYRDWVIEAFNNDLPFDQFTIQQLAGDLLPQATLSDKTATGFLRNTLRNTEAGVDLEEYRLKEIVDRVNTVGIGWLGLSLGCAECHSHKYDPISHREFYQMFSFFNNADDVDVSVPQPAEEAIYRDQLQEWNAVEQQLAAAIGAQLAATDTTTALPDPAELLTALSTEARRRNAAHKTLLTQVEKSDRSELQTLCTQYEKHALVKPKPPSLKAMTVAKRSKERVSYVHLRGDYRSKGEDVVPGTPAALHPLQPRAEQADRLDLARWIVDPANPLTPRVTVNRIWLHLFGRGLVSTVDNFGSGGTPPTHPELLDWLARQQMELGWSRKAMIRLIVDSATYRQASRQRPELEERDPLNELLARQQRFRLEAETIRDAALSVSGLLHPTVGGPSIRPPQPAYVTSISRNAEWKVTTGPDLYRRGLYILLRRATPYPMLLTFDTPDSTAACVQRQRSNSPLQALTLLNDPVFFECAQKLARELDAATNADDAALDAQLATALTRCLGRPPRAAEITLLRNLFEDRQRHFLTDSTAALTLIGAKPEKGQSKNTARTPSITDAARLAAWTITARVLMNLDEFITRE